MNAGRTMKNESLGTPASSRLNRQASCARSRGLFRESSVSSSTRRATKEKSFRAVAVFRGLFVELIDCLDFIPENQCESEPSVAIFIRSNDDETQSTYNDYMLDTWPDTFSAEGFFGDHRVDVVSWS